MLNVFYGSVSWLWESGFYAVSHCIYSVEIKTSVNVFTSETSSYRDALFSLRTLAGRSSLRGRDGWAFSNTSACYIAFCQSNSNSLSDRSEFIVCSVKSVNFFPWQKVREDGWIVLDKSSLCPKTNCNIVTP